MSSFPVFSVFAIQVHCRPINSNLPMVVIGLKSLLICLTKGISPMGGHLGQCLAQ